MRNSESDRECENHLVLLLGYDCFNFIKILLKNRDMVSFCIGLKSATSDSERDKIVGEMKKQPHLKAILIQLEGDDDDEDGMEESVSKSAKKSSSAEGKANKKKQQESDGGKAHAR